MMNKLQSDGISWIILISIIFILLEVSFYNGGVLFFLCFSGFCIYFGKKNYHRIFGKALFWFGLINLTINILNTAAFKFLLFGILILLIVRFADSKKNPKYVFPTIKDTFTQSSEPIMMKKSLLQNVWFGKKQTPEDVYEWNDINIQGGIGDTIIDLGNTVLPKGESVISIRNSIGNIEILVPYDLEVSIHHSVLVGSVGIFNQHEPRAINESLYYQTADYDTSSQKVKIITSMLVGDLEVKRV